MAHSDHVLDGINNDLVGRSRDDYLMMADGWSDPYGNPTIDLFRNFRVVRDDLIDVGSKGRFADLLVQRVKSDHLVYIAPRFGYAALSLARTCKKYGKKLTLFCAASKRLSDHQLAAIEEGPETRFVRIAAMPNLKAYAKTFAKQVGAEFIPAGIKHELVTAAIVSVCSRMEEPSEVWSAISTGVLTRGLQIGWPNARFVGVAVSRNMKAGEVGRATLISYPRPFEEPCKTPPDFPSMLTYDAKAWEEMVGKGKPGALFWNVAGELAPKDVELWRKIRSSREWNDKSDLDPARPGLTVV